MSNIRAAWRVGESLSLNPAGYVCALRHACAVAVKGARLIIIYTVTAQSFSPQVEARSRSPQKYTLLDVESYRLARDNAETQISLRLLLLPFRSQWARMRVCISHRRASASVRYTLSISRGSPCCGVKLPGALSVSHGGDGDHWCPELCRFD